MLTLTLICALLATPLVVLDPGHGGEHLGAIGVNGLQEKELALDIALRTRALLNENGLTRVHLTRIHDEHVELVDRIALANALEATVFVSIHANAAPRRRGKREGVEVYFLSLRSSSSYAAEVAERENDLRHTPRSSRVTPAEENTPLRGLLDDLVRGAAHQGASTLAHLCHDHIVFATRAQARGVFQAPFVVLTGARMPAVLVEVGFIDHPQEGRRLAQESYRASIAQGLSKAIVAFFEQHDRRRPLVTAASDTHP